MNQKQLLKKIRSSFKNEDKTDPFMNRQYVEDTYRILDFLECPYGDLEDTKERAMYDIVKDIFRFLKVKE